MYIEFESLPDHARIWIYQADRKISDENKSVTERFLRDFTQNWAAHGHALQASFKIMDDYFVILAVDETYNGASGCSIDSSVHVIKQLSERTGIDFFNRQLVALNLDDGVELLPLKNLKQKCEERIWSSQTNTFNSLAGTVGEIRRNWLVPAGSTWLNRYITGERVIS